MGAKQEGQYVCCRERIDTISTHFGNDALSGASVNSSFHESPLALFGKDRRHTSAVYHSILYLLLTYAKQYMWEKTAGIILRNRIALLVVVVVVSWLLVFVFNFIF